MGHYDDCYAADYANKREKHITVADIEKLEKQVKEKGFINGYWEDSNCALMAKVAKHSKILQVVNTDYKQFKIVLKDEESKQAISREL